MKILLLETATDVCSVGLLDGDQLLHEIVETEQFKHSSHLTLFIERCLQATANRMTDLDFIALSDGPGSYTSLRVGAATAKGCCVAIPHIGLLAVDTLQSIAYGARSAARKAGAATIIATIASRRGEVYAQAFDPAGTALNQRASIKLDSEAFTEFIGRGQLLICGSGTKAVTEAVTNQTAFLLRPDLHCRAANLAELARTKAANHVTEDLASYEPTYLKPPFVTKSTKKLL